MAVFTGADKKYKPTEQRVDTRLFSQKVGDSWREPEGGFILNSGLLVLSFLSWSMPVVPIISSIVTRVFTIMFLQPDKKLQDLPFRMPETIDGYDGSEMTPDTYFGNKKDKHFYRPKGVTYYGRDLKSNMQVWASDNDDRTHSNIFGTTGSGKTELIHTIVASQLVRNSGAIVVDAKGDITLYERICRLARRFGRDSDVLCITFAIGNKDQNLPQESKNTNTFNLMLNTSSGMLIELLSGLLDGDGGSDDMWKSRAIAFIGALTQPLVFLRDRQEIELSPATYIDFMELPEIERFVYDNKYKYEGFEEVIKPLRSYLTTLPGYNQNLIGNQAQQTNEQFGYITMQMTRSINDLGFTYGHIFGTAVGEIDISDVVLNRRLLIILLPSLERSLPTLLMLSRLIMGSLKQMMASSLGSEIEGSIRLNIDSRPTTANNCYRIILDEVGYMMTTGMSIVPAQARSLNIAMVFAAQDFTDIERGSKEEAQAIWSNAAIKFVGKLTSGEESEMWRRTRGTAGEMEQAVIYQYDRYFTPTMDVAYRAGGQVQKETRSQIKYEEVASQEKGEFTLIASKKYQGGRTGGVAAIHFLCLYTGNLASMGVTYVNDFVPMSTANIKPPDLSKKHEKIKEYLLNGSLSSIMNEAIETDGHLDLGGTQTATNSINKMLYDIQKSCEIQKDSDSFVNLLLETSLNSLAMAMQGLDTGSYHEPKNRLMTEEDRLEFFAMGSVADEISVSMNQVSENEFERAPDVQQAYYRSEYQDEVPQDIADSIAAIHNTGRAVDLRKDEEVKTLIDKFDADGELSLMDMDTFESESEQVKDDLFKNLNEYAEQITVNKSGTAHALLLKKSCSEVAYIAGKPLSDKKKLSMIKDITNHLKK